MIWDEIASELEKLCDGRWWLKPLFGGLLVSAIFAFGIGTEVGFFDLLSKKYTRWINFGFALGGVLTSLGMTVSTFNSIGRADRKKFWLIIGILAQSLVLVYLAVKAVQWIIEIERGYLVSISL